MEFYFQFARSALPPRQDVLRRVAPRRRRVDPVVESLSVTFWVNKDEYDFIYKFLMEKQYIEIFSFCRYKRIRSVRVLGCVLDVFVLERHIQHLREIETSYMRLSVGGYVVRNHHLVVIESIDITCTGIFKISLCYVFNCHTELLKIY